MLALVSSPPSARSHWLKQQHNPKTRSISTGPTASCCLRGTVSRSQTLSLSLSLLQFWKVLHSCCSVISPAGEVLDTPSQMISFLYKQYGFLSGFIRHLHTAETDTMDPWKNNRKAAAPGASDSCRVSCIWLLPVCNSYFFKRQNEYDRCCNSGTPELLAEKILPSRWVSPKTAAIRKE